MEKFFQYFLILFLVFLFVRYLISRLFIINKSNIFLKKHFSEDRLYTADEVAKTFRLDTEDFHRLLKTLEDYNYFLFFKKRGVTMVKDYYSQYELKFLLRLLCKKEKLKL